MNQQTILMVAQLLLKYGIGVARDFVALFQKGDPTVDDWNALFAKAKTYEEYVALPPTPTPTPILSTPQTVIETAQQLTH